MELIIQTGWPNGFTNARINGIPVDTSSIFACKVVNAVDSIFILITINYMRNLNEDITTYSRMRYEETL